jgi:hypothetical protein
VWGIVALYRIATMPAFDDFEEASDWFHRHAGKVEPGPKADGLETFTLTVQGATSSSVGYDPTDLDSYYRAFVEACNELLSRLDSPEP